MQLLPWVVGFALLCFVEAYGLQKRKRWARYVGWVFGFFAVGGVCSQVMPILFEAQSVQDVLVSLVFGVGGMCVWIFWAVWWATHRKMFPRKNGDSVRRA